MKYLCITLASQIQPINGLVGAQIGMSDELKGAIITVLVTSLISIIGFVITIHSMRKSFTDEMRKQKGNIALEKMSTMPFEVLSLMDYMTAVKGDPKDTDINHFKTIMNTIYSYGSENAIKLTALMQKENYENAKKSVGQNKYRVMALFVLLATQIKYDVTGEIVNPEFWYTMRITDFKDIKPMIKEENNKLVNDLELMPGLLIY